MATAIDAPRPTIVVYITEKPRITKHFPGPAERLAIAELKRLGYRILPPVSVRNFPAMCPRDVRGVWNADRLTEFRKYFNADILWMAGLEYKVTKAYGAYPVGGTMSIAATAFSADTGKPLWFGKIEDHELKGRTAEEAARRAVSETIPAMVKRFDLDPRIRTWVPTERPRPWPPGVRILTPPRITSTSGPATTRHPEALSRGRPDSRGYTGVIVEAEHLRVFPSYRTRLYSDRGRPVLLPDGVRMGWADRPDIARRLSGTHPLRIRALRSERGRIVLRDRDARLLGRQKELLKRGPVTIVVRPPRR